MNINVSSPAFKDGEMIPPKYTCDGMDVSPPIEWENIPDQAKSIALVCDDPDAPMGTWVHWVVFNLPADLKGLPENSSPGFILSNNAKEGINNFRKTSYGGPCPPAGTHRYFFKVYALDLILNINDSINKEKLLNAMNGHIIASGQLMGKYTRK